MIAFILKKFDILTFTYEMIFLDVLCLKKKILVYLELLELLSNDHEIGLWAKVLDGNSVIRLTPLDTLSEVENLIKRP
jgi:hypothetical protein